MIIPLKGIAYEVTSTINGQGPWTDGRKSACADMELNYAECMEAYGAVNGTPRCQMFLEDLKECKFMAIRKMRFYAMRMERYKKMLKGELTFKDGRWGKPYEYDSFTSGTFFP